MSDKLLLRKTRFNTVINSISKGQEKEVITALKIVVNRLQATFPNIRISHQSTLNLKYVVEKLRKQFENIDFCCKFDGSFMKPDGGFLHIVAQDGAKYPILISEVKNQGTNDLRAEEGLKKTIKRECYRKVR